MAVHTHKNEAFDAGRFRSWIKACQNTVVFEVLLSFHARRLCKEKPSANDDQSFHGIVRVLQEKTSDPGELMLLVKWAGRDKNGSCFEDSWILASNLKGETKLNFIRAWPNFPKHYFINPTCTTDNTRPIIGK